MVTVHTILEIDGLVKDDLVVQTKMKQLRETFPEDDLADYAEAALQFLGNRTINGPYYRKLATLLAEQRFFLSENSLTITHHDAGESVTMKMMLGR